MINRSDMSLHVFIVSIAVPEGDVIGCCLSATMTGSGSIASGSLIRVVKHGNAMCCSVRIVLGATLNFSSKQSNN
jgi:hypothetical protein